VAKAETGLPAASSILMRALGYGLDVLKLFPATLVEEERWADITALARGAIERAGEWNRGDRDQVPGA
jgi:2-keto-3-deoxy-6-phosphogluconate aldolase